jgi:hypothetical protein
MKISAPRLKILCRSAGHWYIVTDSSFYIPRMFTLLVSLADFENGVQEART